MNDELAWLREDVREAIEICRQFIPATDMDGKPNAWHAIELELLRLAREDEVHWKTRRALIAERDKARAELAALKRWAQEARGYLTAAAESSMSRNNSEEIAGELLDDLAALLPVGGENER